MNDIQRWIDIADDVLTSVIIALCVVLAIIHINDYKQNKK